MPYDPIRGLPMGERPGTGAYGSDAQGPFGPAQYSSNPNDYYQSPNAWYGNPYAMSYAQWYNSQYGPETQEQGGQVQLAQQDFRSQFHKYGAGADQAYGVNSGLAGNLPSTMQYTDPEQGQILREQERRGSMTTPEQYAQMQWDPTEQANYQGDPYAAYNTFAGNVGNAYRDIDTQEGRTFDALGSSDQILRGYGDRYGQQSAGILDTAGNGMRGAAYSPDLFLDEGYGGRQQATLSAGEAAARGIYQDPNLEASSEFMNDYKFGPQDTLDLEALAGTAVGSRYRGQIEDLKRDAAKQGTTSPMALAAMEDRFGRQSAQEAADAAIGARSQGRQLELATTKGREDTRLGALQKKAGYGLDAELTLGGRRLGAESETEQLRLNAAQKARGMQMGAEGSLAQMGLASASDVAGFQAGNERAQEQARLGAYGTLGSSRQGLNQFATSGLTQTQGAGEAAASGRAATTADQRVANTRANTTQQFGQGQTVAGSLSDASRGIADRRLSGEQERRGYLTGMTGASQQGMLTSTGQAQNFINGRNQAGTAAAGVYGGYDTARRGIDANARNPSGWDQVIGAATGALGSYRP